LVYSHIYIYIYIYRHTHTHIHTYIVIMGIPRQEGCNGKRINFYLFHGYLVSYIQEECLSSLTSC
jgi:hypothetical protein